MHETGISASQFPIAYVFTIVDIEIHLIDTPVIEDKRGYQKDI